MKKNQNKNGFYHYKNDPTDGHKGFGIGSLSLENVSPVIVDVEEGRLLLKLVPCMQEVT